jgi:hypothetical protein
MWSESGERELELIAALVAKPPVQMPGDIYRVAIRDAPRGGW